MLKKFNQINTEKILISIIFLLLGIIILIYPQISINVLAYMIAGLFIVSGIYLIGIDLYTRNLFFPMDTLLNGIFSILLGVITLIYPNIFRVIIPIILGTYFIVTSILKLRIVSILKDIDTSSWILSIITTILSIICGIILIINPMDTSIALTIFAGIMIMIYSISNIIDMTIFKRNINDIVKTFKKNIKIIDE